MTAPSDEPFPEMHDAVLSSDELSALFRDYRECAVVGEILVKPGPGFVSTESAPTLEQAEELLRNRAVRGVQVRYQFNDGAWWDTLMQTPAGVRLVRIRQ